ncbi:hypothetical protein [Cellulomonas fimi]|uniref:hypothetical protein n=1 Tax=Cellulomonas fimi TaxID=1708 RepID=UPI002359DA8F|nr:hypothetical protein [Cellulomonas fimi]
MVRTGYQDVRLGERPERAASSARSHAARDVSRVVAPDRARVHAPDAAQIRLVQRTAGNRAATRLLDVRARPVPVQRGQEGGDPTPTPQPGAGNEPATLVRFGALLEKSVGPKVEGAVTRILLWKTDGPVAHKQHWWLILEASSPEGATGWFQLDLTLADGPRVLWGAGAHKANSLVQQVAVPEGLTSGAVVDAARGVAATAYHYNPAALPQPTDYPRYSCQNFVRDVAARTGITL